MSERLEKALLLPDDMQELKGLRKCKVFLSLKRNLVKVSFCTSALMQLFHILYVKNCNMSMNFSLKTGYASIVYGRGMGRPRSFKISKGRE